MKSEKSPEYDLYYTYDHEWIEFQGAVAYTGICSFKLTGFKEIQEINFKVPSGYLKKGEVIATLKYNDYQVELHMPVDGTVIQVNEKLIELSTRYLLECTERSGWMAIIVPFLPEERNGLMLPGQYAMKIKRKYEIQ